MLIHVFRGSRCICSCCGKALPFRLGSTCGRPAAKDCRVDPEILHAMLADMASAATVIERVVEKAYSAGTPRRHVKDVPSFRCACGRFPTRWHWALPGRGMAASLGCRFCATLFYPGIAGHPEDRACTEVPLITCDAGPSLDVLLARYRAAVEQAPPPVPAITVPVEEQLF